MTSSPDTFEVLAVRYGRLHATKASLTYRFSSYGVPDAPQDLDYFFYVLRGGGRTILVDTGFDLEAAAEKGRICMVPPRDALTQLGIDPAEIDQLLITHFHWDHIGDLSLAPNAEILVPQAELDFWERPVSRHPLFFEHTDPDGLSQVLAAARTGRAKPLPEDGVIAPGLRSETVGGHAAGQQILHVETEDGPVVLASDAVHLYEEYELERPFNVIVDLGQVVEAYAKLKELERSRGVTMVPGHDPEVANRHHAVAGLEGDFAYCIG